MNSPPAACLIVHGKCAAREDVRAAVHAVRNEGWRVDMRITEKAGDARDFARYATGAGFDVVIAGGGDGTINEVVGGLVDGVDLQTPIPAFGILPLGTANDLALACRIPLDPLAALHLAVSAPATRVDVGRVNGRSFLNMATGGFGAQVTTETSEELKLFLGKAAYLVTAVTHFDSIRPARGVLWGPDFVWEGEFLFLAVGNSRTAGGGYQLCPEAKLNDGLFDVRLLPDLPAEEIGHALGVLFGEGLDAIGSVIRARVGKLHLEADEPIQINLDGEPIMDTRFRFEVLHRRLRMKLPLDCPLV